MHVNTLASTATTNSKRFVMAHCRASSVFCIGLLSMARTIRRLPVRANAAPQIGVDGAKGDRSGRRGRQARLKNGVPAAPPAAIAPEALCS
jgi:hypothetical protein